MPGNSEGIQPTVVSSIKDFANSQPVKDLGAAAVTGAQSVVDAAKQLAPEAVKVEDATVAAISGGINKVKAVASSQETQEAVAATKAAAKALGNAASTALGSFFKKK